MKHLGKNEALIGRGLFFLPLCGLCFVIDWSDLFLIGFLLLLAGSLLWQILSAVKTLREVRDLSFFVFLGLGLWYVWPALVVLSASTVCDWEPVACASADTRSASVGTILLFYVGICFWYGLRPKSRSPGIAVRFSIPLDNAALVIALCMFFIFAAVVFPVLQVGSIADFISALYGGRYVEKEWLPSGNLGDSDTAINLIVRSFGLAGSSIGIYFSLAKGHRIFARRSVSLGVLAVSLAGLLLFALDSGTRSLTLIVILPGLLAILTRVRKQRFLLAAVAATALAFLSQFQLLIRDSSIRSWTLSDLYSDILTLNGSLDFFSESTYAIYLFESNGSVGPDFLPYHFAVWPIPRAIWPDKPYSEVARTYTLARWNIDILTEGGVVLPGALGQQILSWGFYGVLFLVLYLAVTEKVLERLCRFFRNTEIERFLFFIFGAWVLTGFRMVSPGFSLVPICAVAILAVTRVRLR